MADGSVGVGTHLKRWGIGAALVFAGFEAIFRVAQPFLQPPVSTVRDAKLTILCEGDSFTYGIGGRSFPVQLEALLNERHGPGTARAINVGVPGLNSAVLVDNLEQHFIEYQPDVAIVLIGENNSWNSLRVSDSTWLGTLDAWAMHSRVYKFIKVATVGWNNATFHEAIEQVPAQPILEESEGIGLAFPSGEFSPEKRIPPAVDAAETERFVQLVQFIEVGDYPACVEGFRKFVEDHPDIPQGYAGLGSCQMRLNLLEEAADTFHRGTQARFDDSMEELHFLEGSALQRLERHEEAAAAFYEGLTRFPRSRALGWGWSELHHRTDRTFEALSILTDIPETRDNDVIVYLQRLADQAQVSELERAVSDAFRADLERMVALAKQYQVTLVFSSYPDTTYQEVADVATANGQIYVSFPPHFERRFASREEYISPDRCHCNTEGYQLMAEVFADTLGGMLGPAQP